MPPILRTPHRNEKVLTHRRSNGVESDSCVDVQEDPANDGVNAKHSKRNKAFSANSKQTPSTSSSPVSLSPSSFNGFFHASNSSSNTFSSLPQKQKRRRRNRRREFPTWKVAAIVMAGILMLLIAVGLFLNIRTDPASIFPNSTSKTTKKPQFKKFSPSAPSTCDSQLSVDDVDFTLVTQVSSDRLWMMEHQCRRWKYNNETFYPISLSVLTNDCLLYTSPSPRDQRGSRMPSSA